MSDTKKVCIIGSAPSVMEEKKGKEIDSFENVVRFNRAPIVGYEEFVGEKTDFRFANRMVWRNLKEHKKENGKILSTFKNQIIIMDKDNNPFSKSNFYKIFHKSCTFMFISRNNAVKKMLKNELPHIKFNGKNPTGGMAVISHFINKGYEVTIYGFGLDDNINKKIIPHFYEDKNVKTSHDYNYEVNILNSLLEKGKIKKL